MNKKYFIILIQVFLYSQTTQACGEYLISALVKAQEDDFVLLVNPGTVSEIRLLYSLDDFQKLAAYENRFVETKIIISNQMDKTRGSIDSFGEIKVLVPNPLINNQNTSMKLFKKATCKK